MDKVGVLEGAGECGGRMRKLLENISQVNSGVVKDFSLNAAFLLVMYMDAIETLRLSNF